MTGNPLSNSKTIIRKIMAVTAAAIAIAAFSGCTKKRTPLPPELFYESTVLGMTGVRTLAFEYNAGFEADLLASVKQELRYSPTGHNDTSGHFNVLALSGGGSYGAFGAGILNGWSASGTRPTFKMVTGISTGALIAPFAFLGEDYDQVLKQVYTAVTTKEIMQPKAFFISESGLDSLADSAPLQRLIEKYVSVDVIRGVARAHQTGRRLYIGTTDLDAGRLVIWNMGIVAAGGRPETDDLFRKILLASASIPILLPPVYIPVEVGDETYGEIHVDGGIANQVFFYGDILDLDDFARLAGLSSVSSGRLYIIQNQKSIPPYEPVKPNLVDISKKSIVGIIANQGNGDLYRIYLNTQRGGIEFKLVFIPPDVKLRDPLNFDPDSMQKLFDLGYRMALSGDPWQNHPPGYRRVSP